MATKTSVNRSEASKEQQRENSRNWKKNNKLKRAIYQIKLKYNISWDEFMYLIEQQKYQCSICKLDLVLPGGIMNANNTAHVDHDHSTGKVRGLLCKNCNRALGFFKDNIDILESAASYLKENSNGC